jgi:predicted RNase H-like HicB family nuclease
MNELIFEVNQESDGGYSAECLTENIFTQGNSWAELCANVKEAVAAFYFDKPAPRHVRLRLVRDETLALP